MNAKLNEMHAALALASLDVVEDQLARYRRHYLAYRRLAASIRGIRLPALNERPQPSLKEVEIELDAEWPLSCADTVDVLGAERVLVHGNDSPPSHRHPMAYSGDPGRFPLTEGWAEKFLNLPCGQLVSDDEIAAICEVLEYVYANAKQITHRLHGNGAV